MEKEEIVKYLMEKGYPISTSGDIPTYEQSMQIMTEYCNYQKTSWIEKTCKWLEEEAAKYTEIDSEALKEAYIKVCSDYQAEEMFNSEEFEV